MKLLLPLLALALLSGCAGMKLNPYIDLSTAGQLYQAAHVIDMAQTIEIAKDSCYNESAFLTQQLIGERPSTRSVVAWGLANSYLAAQADQAIQRSNLPDWTKTTAQYVGLAWKVDYITGNHAIGIRIGSKNKPTNGCIRHEN